MKMCDILYMISTVYEHNRYSNIDNQLDATVTIY